MTSLFNRLAVGTALLFSNCASPLGPATIAAETAQEKASMIPASAFAQLPAMSDVQLSPQGRFLAYKTSHEGRTYVMTMERETSKKKVLPPIAAANIVWYRWVNSTGLLISYGFENDRNYIRGKISETRLAYYDAAKDKFRWTIKQGGQKYANSRLRGEVLTAQFQDNIIDFLPREPEMVLQAIDSDLDGDYEVRRLNVKNGNTKLVYPGTRGIQNWKTDQSHEIRYGWGAARGIGYQYRYRTSDGRLVNADDLEWHQRGFRPITFTDDPAIAYVAGPSKTGREGLFKMNLDTGEIIEEVFVHEDVDIDGLIHTGADGISGMSASGKPVAVTFTHHLPELKYFDGRSEKIQQIIDKSLPGTRNRIVSQVPELLQFVIRADGPNDPGVYYLLDLKKKSLDALAERMPGLTPDYMAVPTPRSFTARDGTEVPGYLTAPVGSDGKDMPTILYIHGGPYARVDMRFDPIVQFLASRGYAVYQPNFRGSSGFGDAYEAAGYNQWGGLMQDDITDAAKWLLESGIASPSRLCVMGGSYGGYAAALASIQSPGTFRCAISFNGVLDLPGMIANDRYGLVGGEALVKTIGLDGASPESISPFHLADQIDVPMLLVAAEDDARVDAAQSRRMHDKLRALGKPSDLMMLPEGGHGLDTAPARTVFLEKVERFLESEMMHN